MRVRLDLRALRYFLAGADSDLPSCISAAESPTPIFLPYTAFSTLRSTSGSTV